MIITNDRSVLDYAILNPNPWSGNILIGNDGYPKINGHCYLIAGGKNWCFKATAIEFYGVNSQTNSKQYSKPKSLKKKGRCEIF